MTRRRPSPVPSTNRSQSREPTITCCHNGTGRCSSNDPRASWKTYYIKTKAVIMVIDSTDKDRLHLSRTELHTMMEDEVSNMILVDA